jgi:signal transduction histidine kinase
MESLLRVINLTKFFGTLPAVQQVSFEVQPGEVVGLTGSIGSGKSVLAMLLAGLYDPTEGEIYFANKRLNWPFAANSLGISVIYQRAILIDQFDVVGNIFLGNEIYWPAKLGGLGVLNRSRMIQETIRILAQLGIDANIIHEKVINISGEQRQMIAIARVLTHPARMIIIDDPTILLSYLNQQMLLGLIQGWRQQGVSVMFSSSNLDHLFAVTDRIIILDQGRKVADLQTDETTREAVVSHLLGTVDPRKPSPAIWDFDSYDRIRAQAEKMRYRQILLAKNLSTDDTLQRQLIEQLTEQVQSLDQANLALLEAQRRLLSEREKERKHLARELHDQIIQDLLSVNYKLEEMKAEETIMPGMVNDLSNVHQGIRELIDNLRHICGDLRPLTIDSLGLGAALQSYTRDWSLRTSIKVDLNLDANLGRLPEAAELSIFRIVQEGLNNVWRHAQASCVQVSLQHSSPRMLMVSLRDDGQGLAEDIDLASLAANSHYGLIGIGERVAILGGRFRLQSLPEGGSLLMVEIPHPRVDVNPETATY